MKPIAIQSFSYRETYCQCPDCGWRFKLRKLDSGEVEGPDVCSLCRRELGTLIAAIPAVDWRKP